MENNLEIRSGSYSFERYFDLKQISQQEKEKLNSIDILAIPSPYINGEYYFAQETIDFIKFCRSNNNQYTADILADKDIVTRELRSFDIWMPMIYVSSSIILPFVINIVSNYVWEKMKGREHEDARVKLTLIVNSGDEQKELHYDGDAKTFAETFEKIDLNQW